jgi:hypothetical protein
VLLQVHMLAPMRLHCCIALLQAVLLQATVQRTLYLHAVAARQQVHEQHTDGVPAAAIQQQQQQQAGNAAADPKGASAAGRQLLTFPPHIARGAVTDISTALATGVIKTGLAQLLRWVTLTSVS